MADPVLNLEAPRVVRVAAPSIGQTEEEAVLRVLRSGHVSQGPAVAEFERRFAASHGQDFGVACCSGTSALQLALAGLRIGASDRVLLPSCTMVAVANAVLYVGAVPIFCDSDPLDGNPRLCGHSIRERPTCVIVPHLYGQPAEHFIAEVNAQLPGVAIIEDCAEAHFATFDRGQPVGRRSDAACFSFYANKVLAAGEGGMVLTSRQALAERMRSLRAHAFTPGDHFHHQELAFGMRMTDMQAGLGLAQLSRRNELLAKRTAIANAYHNELRDCPWIDLPTRSLGSVWWVFPLTVRREAPVTRDELRARLAAAGIETRTYFFPLHRQPHLRRYATADCPVADYLGANGMYLPLHPCMTEGDVEYVLGVIRGIGW